VKKTDKILITGGAGFLGINLIRYLLERGYTSITSLDIAVFDYPEKDRIKAIQGDIRDPLVVRHAMAETDLLIHTATTPPRCSEQVIRSTEVEGTGNLLQAALEHQVTRIIYLSSTAVYGIPECYPIYENDPLIGVDPYGQAKIAVEGLCAEYRARGLCIPVLRPKSLIGPEPLEALDLLFSRASQGRGFPVAGSGCNRYQLLDVEDLCQAILLCATLPEDLVNDTFNIGAVEFSTLKEDFQAVLDTAGYGKRIIPLPRCLAVATLRILELLHISPLYKSINEMLGKSSAVSVNKACNQLGFHPAHSNVDALLRTYRWYLENHSTINQAAGA
jgi:nucleoside-diphosphate-sugar epimerase